VSSRRYRASAACRPAAAGESLFYWWMRSGAGLGGMVGMSGLGKSRARRYDSGSAQRTTFEESHARFPRFENEVQGAFPEEDEDGHVHLFTYVVRTKVT
jgi:hypothetical protein